VEELLSIEEFRRLELRVARVVRARVHPNADKLLVLDVDLGGEKRQLVAGIRSRYGPEELEGRSIVVVANLEPAKIRGVESQGMLLAADDGSGPVLVCPQGEVAPGATVK
jgi:methionyl-tRNA synthetase C-terminal region/beta chain